MTALNVNLNEDHAILSIPGGQFLLYSLKRSFASKLVWCILTLFFATWFILDMIDLACRGWSHDFSPKRFSPLITAISFSSSQVSISRAFATCIFVSLKSELIISCAVLVKNGLKTFKIPQQQIRMETKYIWGQVILIAACSVSPLIIQLTANDDEYWTEIYYGLIPTKNGPVTAWLVFLTGITTTFSFSFEALFYYLSSMVLGCMESFEDELNNLMSSDKKLRCPSTEFIDALKTLRVLYESSVKLFNSVQSPFCGKLLFDLVMTIAEILIATAWFSVFAAEPSATRIYSKCFRKSAGAFIGVLRLLILINRPLKLDKMQTTLAEKFENIMFQRQKNRTENPKLEELEMAHTLLRRIKSQRSTLSAGQMIDLDQSSVFTCICIVIGFICFVIDRMEGFKAKL